LESTSYRYTNNLELITTFRKQSRRHLCLKSTFMAIPRSNYDAFLSIVTRMLNYFCMLQLSAQWKFYYYLSRMSSICKGTNTMLFPRDITAFRNLNIKLVTPINLSGNPCSKITFIPSTCIRNFPNKCVFFLPQ